MKKIQIGSRKHSIENVEQLFLDSGFSQKEIRLLKFIVRRFDENDTKFPDVILKEQEFRELFSLSQKYYPSDVERALDGLSRKNVVLDDEYFVSRHPLLSAIEFIKDSIRLTLNPEMKSLLFELLSENKSV